MIKEEIKKIIQEASGAAEVVIETPKDKLHGDYSTNVALILAKNLNKNSTDVAKEIVSKIGKNSLFEKVEVAGMGFINFSLADNFFREAFKKINKNFGKNNNLKSKKIIIEYTDPNILKEFHIGHLMSNTIGESIARIIEFHGAKIKKLCYQGDVGLHVAKAIFGKVKNQNYTWQQSYVFGSSQYETDEIAKKEIIELNKKVFEKSDGKINKLYQGGRKWSLESFDKIYKKLGTKFDYLFFESETAGFGKRIVEEGLKKGIFEKGLPAQAGEKEPIVFKGEKYGLHTRVFINSEGLPTYEAKELGLAKIKYDKYKYDNSIIITANEQNEYFKVVISAMSQIFPDLARKTLQIGHGMMRLPEGKMSSRTGQVVTAESLIEKVKEMVDQKLTGRNFSEKEKEKISEQVAIGAIKYSILKQSIGSDIIYDFEKSISFEGDSGPYLQYSYVRAASVLKKAKKEKIKSDTNLLMTREFTNIEISGLERMLHRFPEVIEEAGEKYKPHLISTYLIELARGFNNYYAKNKIVDKDDGVSPHKVALTQVFSIIMKNGLWLLGIQAPEKM